MAIYRDTRDTRERALTTELIMSSSLTRSNIERAKKKSSTPLIQEPILLKLKFESRVLLSSKHWTGLGFTKKKMSGHWIFWLVFTAVAITVKTKTRDQNNHVEYKQEN